MRSTLSLLTAFALCVATPALAVDATFTKRAVLKGASYQIKGDNANYMMSRWLTGLKDANGLMKIEGGDLRGRDLDIALKIDQSKSQTMNSEGAVAKGNMGIPRIPGEVESAYTKRIALITAKLNELFSEPRQGERIGATIIAGNRILVTAIFTPNDPDMKEATARLEADAKTKIAMLEKRERGPGDDDARNGYRRGEIGGAAKLEVDPAN